jgi:predicted nucleic acid-binding protein
VVDFLTEKQVFISAVTELELFGKPNMSKENITIINDLIDSCYILDLTQPVKQIVKKLIQKQKIKLPDAIIAATAIYSDIPLVTFDSGFSNIEGLKLVLLNL